MSVQRIEIEYIHSWLKTISVYQLPGWSDPVLDVFFHGLLESFQSLGNQVLDAPSMNVDLILTSARFGEAASWRTAPLFTLRKRFRLNKLPTVVTVLHATRREYFTLMVQLENALSRPNPEPADFQFVGLSKNAFLTLYEQGRRGGAILALERLLQAQSMSIRVILLVGDEGPDFAYSFDLVGAYPRSEAGDGEAFYNDLALRLLTATSTRENTGHQSANRLISRSQWNSLISPRAMIQAGYELGARNFFSEMIRINDLVTVPSVPETIASQYSEGCFATWDPVLQGMVITITGSARPVRKKELHDDDLAVVVGILPDHSGALVCQVEGSSNSPPSSEAVELFDVDRGLPVMHMDERWCSIYGSLDTMNRSVPVVRSKLHGHRAVGSFDPRYAEYVALAPQYQRYPVSCASEAQAQAIFNTFSTSAALKDTHDPRKIAFTILPGHGSVILEKWQFGKEPFQLIWEAMDAGHLQIASQIPQGVFGYLQDATGRMVLTT